MSPLIPEHQVHVIVRRVQFAACLASAVGAARTASAQHPHLTRAEVVQIVNQALAVVVPPSEELSGTSVADRGLAFDMQRTLAAFGAPTGGATSLRLDGGVAFASRSLLHDCSQEEQKACAALGSRVYVFLEPLSVTSTRATVRVNMSWADRVHFGASRSRPGYGYLAGASHKLYFVRDASGAWKFEKQDRTVITS